MFQFKKLTCAGARSAGCGKTCAFTSLGARRCGNSSLLAFSSTLLLRTRRKTRPFSAIHTISLRIKLRPDKPVGAKPWSARLTNPTFRGIFCI